MSLDGQCIGSRRSKSSIWPRLPVDVGPSVMESSRVRLVIMSGYTELHVTVEMTNDLEPGVNATAALVGPLKFSVPNQDQQSMKDHK